MRGCRRSSAPTTCRSVWQYAALGLGATLAAVFGFAAIGRGGSPAAIARPRVLRTSDANANFRTR